MRVDEQQRDWEDLAELDPFWAILSHRDKRHGRWEPEEFFATGEREVAQLLGVAEELGLPRERGLALDFGSGYGRATRALAARFDRALGLDVSERMVAGARELNADVEGCEFAINAASDLGQIESGSVDLVYTRHVLQHLPDAAAARGYVAEFVRVLRPGGLAIFQLPAHIRLRHRLQPQRRAYAALRRAGVAPAVLYRRLNLVPIHMTAVPESAIEATVAAAGGRMVRTDPRPASYGRSATYFATRD